MGKQVPNSKITVLKIVNLFDKYYFVYLSKVDSFKTLFSQH